LTSSGRQGLYGGVDRVRPFAGFHLIASSAVAFASSTFRSGLFRFAIDSVRFRSFSFFRLLAEVGQELKRLERGETERVGLPERANDLVGDRIGLRFFNGGKGGKKIGLIGRVGAGRPPCHFLQLFQDLFGPRDDFGREPGEPGDLDAVALVGPSFDHLS